MSRSGAAEKIEVENGITLHLTEDPSQEAERRTVAIEGVLSLARENRVQLRQDTQMIDALLDYSVIGSIPPELYRAVGELLVFIRRLETPRK
jgi:type III secretion system FlhB-like substrate exporter